MALVHQWLQHRLVVPLTLAVCGVAALLLVFAGVWLPPLALVLFAVVIVLCLITAWAGFLIRFLHGPLDDDRPLGVIARENSLGAWMHAHTGRLRAIRQSLPVLPMRSDAPQAGKHGSARSAVVPSRLADHLALTSAITAPDGPPARTRADARVERQMPAVALRRTTIPRRRSAIPAGAGFAAPPQVWPASRAYRTPIPALPASVVRDSDAVNRPNDYV